jgi:hypothetical protein
MNSLVKALSVGASRFGQQPDISWARGDAQPASTGLRSWLLSGTGYSAVYRHASGEISIECIDDTWARANASDLIANREAAVESLLPRQHNIYSNRAVAWPFVTSYYSAYFAAQSFLRCLGLGSIYLEQEESNLVSAAWAVRGFPIPITPGNYNFSIDLTTPVKISLRKLGSAGGAHQQFWTGFRQSQADIHRVLLLSPGLNTLSTTTRQAADGDYGRLVQLCFTNTSEVPSTPNFVWLAKLRNEINYRFHGHLWLMNWRHSAGLISNHQTLVDRYSTPLKSLPEAQRNFSKAHLIFVAARFCQLIQDATLKLSIP